MTRPSGNEGGRTLREGDRVFRVEAAADGTLQVTPGGGRVLVDRVGQDTYRVIGDGGAWRAVVAASGDRRQVFVEGEVYEIDAGPPVKRRPAAGRDGMLTAPMPARVREVRVAVGQDVSSGDVLVTLEAMKMELSIRSPRDGRVAAVSCREGEMVPQGVPLLELE